MATTYKILDKSILGSDQASLTFSSLGTYSTDYTDLKIVASIRGAIADTIRGVYISINGSTSSFSQKYLRGYNTGTDSGSIARFSGDANAANSTANTFSSFEFYFPNFSSSNNKSYSVDWASENNSGGSFACDMGFIAGLWSNTSAITSITLAFDSGNILSGSSFYLYGIKNS